MSAPPVVDASPLIVLAKAGCPDLLRLAGEPVMVPTAVMAEIASPDAADPVALAVAAAPWLRTVDPGPGDPRVEGCGLGAGEQAVLTWAVAHPGTEAILDDLAARHRAKELGVPCRGCLGLVLAAKRAGVIPSARSVLERLAAVGMRVGDKLLNNPLTLVGERRVSLGLPREKWIARRGLQGDHGGSANRRRHHRAAGAAFEKGARELPAEAGV